MCSEVAGRIQESEYRIQNGGRFGQSGVTLVELVVSMMIVSIALGGVLMVFNQTVSRSADPMLQHQAIAIAEAYLEEILLRPYEDPDVIGGESRPNYDDIFDYHNLHDVGARNQNGALAPGLGSYEVRVQVVAGDFGPAGAQVPAADAARIEVTVSHPSGINLTLAGFRTRY